MRALPDLTELQPQPSVFDQSTDDFNATFANEFAGIDSEQAAADQQTPAIFAGMDPISQAITDLGGAMDAAASVFDILSGDLDTVDLTPEIVNFQLTDSALDSNLSNVAFDFTDAGLQLFNQFLSLGSEIFQEVVSLFQAIIQNLENTVAYLIQEMSSVLITLSGGGGNV